MTKPQKTPPTPVSEYITSLTQDKMPCDVTKSHKNNSTRFRVLKVD